MESHWPHRTEKRSLFSLAVSNEGSICLWYLYVYICTGIFLYFLISWLFQMGSHWPHWTVKRSLCALAVSNGGSFCLWHPYVYICTGIFLYFLISWLFRMSSHWQYRYTKSSLFSLAVSCGGRTLADKGLSAKFELISSFALASQSSFVLIRNERPIM